MSARTGRAFASAFGLLILAAAGPAPADETRLQEYFRLRKEAAAAQQAGEAAKAQALLHRALDLYPDVPGSYIRLARAQVAAGELDAALANLETYARMGLLLDVERDPALKALTALPGYAEVAAVLKNNARPVGKPALVAGMAGSPEFIGEGIVDDGQGGLLMSTVSGRTIQRVTPANRPWLQVDKATGAIFGMAVDRKRGVLWAAEAWGEGVPGDAGPPRTGLLKVSLADGAILGRVPLPDDGGRHQLGDVTVAEDGTVYASDSDGGGIWRLRPGTTTPDLLVPPGRLMSPQGMAICPGGEAMLTADYSTGLYRVDLKTGGAITMDGLMTGLAGTDGLVAVPGFDFRMRNASPLPFAVVATQNGVSPQRVLLLRVSPDCTTIEGAATVVANHPGVDDVTLATVEGMTVTFVGHARWSERGEDMKAPEEPGLIRVFAAPLPESAH